MAKPPHLLRLFFGGLHWDTIPLAYLGELHVFFMRNESIISFLPSVSQTKDLEQRRLPSQISGSTTECVEKTACGECEPTEPLVRILQ